MDDSHLQQIMDHYIAFFPESNGPAHTEYYKWQIIQRFRPAMDEALAASDAELPVRLAAVKKLTRNLIDSHTQPLNGLVAFSKEEPATVRSMFTELFQAAEKTVAEKQEAIQSFLNRSHQLREKYYPDSYLYNDDMHSVTGYLFFYDPDHNYLFKATHCRTFADCIEFFDDWGTGESVKLDVFYRMCDETLEAIRKNEDLMAVAARRYEIGQEDMHPDTEKHILLFDLIYCCSTYHLFNGIEYSVPKGFERRLLQGLKEKAKELEEHYDAAAQRLAELEKASEYTSGVFREGLTIRHKAFGEGKIIGTDGGSITVQFPTVGVKNLGTNMCVANGLITLEDGDVLAKLEGFRDILRQEQQIRNAVLFAEKALMPFAEYLE